MSFAFWLPSRNVRPGHNGRRHHGERRTRAVAPSRRLVPRFEALEDRTLLSTFHVLNLGDAGDGSLPAAVLAANENPGADVIQLRPATDGHDYARQPVERHG